MRQALRSKDNPADVINVALEALSAQRCELPACLTLDREIAATKDGSAAGRHGASIRAP